MSWISVLDVVVSWLSSIFDFVMTIFNKFPFYLSVVFILTFIYFSVQKLLQPIFDGHLPEGSSQSELRAFEKAYSDSGDKRSARAIERLRGSK